MYLWTQFVQRCAVAPRLTALVLFDFVVVVQVIVWAHAALEMAGVSARVVEKLEQHCEQ